MRIFYVSKSTYATVRSVAPVCHYSSTGEPDEHPLIKDSHFVPSCCNGCLRLYHEL